MGKGIEKVLAKIETVENSIIKQANTTLMIISLVAFTTIVVAILVA